MRQDAPDARTLRSRHLQPSTDNRSSSRYAVAMRVTLSRSGGVAGLLPPPVTVDTAALPRAVAARMKELVASADFFNLPRTLAAQTRQPDRLQFTVRIAEDDGSEHTVTCDEEVASAAFLELVRAVHKAARK